MDLLIGKAQLNKTHTGGMAHSGCLKADHASAALGKWLKKHFGMTAHSLRHTFRDRLRASGCPLELIDQICGWSSIGTIGSKYGLGYPLHSVQNFIEKIAINREIDDYFF